MSVNLDVDLEAIRLGDVSAFERFVAGAERPLRESLRPLAAHVDSEAVVQEAFLRVWQVAPRVESDGKPNSLLRFAVRVARNLAMSELRRTRAASTTPDLDELPEVSPSALPDPLLRQAIVDCQGALPPQPARALAARIESAGEADEDLAERLGMRPNTFLQNFTRARKLLADCLHGKGIQL
jgi:RNA polymerase sigma factor (sigma-70 family)